MNIHRIHQSTGHRAALYTLIHGLTPTSLITAGGDGWLVSWDIHNPETGTLLATTSAQIFSLVLLPNNNIVAGDINGGLYWINLLQPDQTAGIKHHHKAIFDLCLLPDNTLLSASGDGRLSRWNTQSQQVIESLHLSNNALRCITLKYPHIAIGDSNGHIYLLDALNLNLLNKIEKAHSNSVFTLSFSPDGRYLLSGGRDAMLRVWELNHETMSCTNAQPAHWFTINHIAFDPTGHYFATASRDKTIKIWDAHTLKLLKVADTIRSGAHNHSINRLLWLSDTEFASVSDDRTMMLWKWEPSE